MEEQKNLSPAFQTVLAPATAHPDADRSYQADHGLNVAVVFTSVAGTVAALRKAAALADHLSPRIKMVVPQVVPYPLPLESPPVLFDFSERTFRRIASESPLETNVEIYLCRDAVETLKAVLAPGSLVVIGGRKRWWPTREKTWARKLRRCGHEVVFTETELTQNA
jgi:hypothetical protein